MSTEKASPAVESLGTQEKRIANILLRFLNEVKEPMEMISFLSRIVEEGPEIDPGSAYLCDICGQMIKGREGKVLNNGAFVCNWCRHAEMSFDVYPKEGE